MKGKRIIAFATTLFTAAAIGLPWGTISAQVSVQSPEELRQGPHSPRCTTDSECPEPVPRSNQNSACLAPRCILETGVCDSNGRVLVGKAIPKVLMPSGAECLVNPVICSDSGSLIADLNKNLSVEDGQACSLPSSERRMCQKSLCMSGSCVNVADASLNDHECGESQDEGCITKTPFCNTQGECVTGAGKKLRVGVQCAPPGQLRSGLVIAKPEFLPASFIVLFTQWTSPPDYLCGEDCKLQYCGDGIRNNETEACDGKDIPATAPAGSSCNGQCTLEYCGDGKINNNGGDGKINNNGGEQCDGSALPLNALPGSTCSADCTFHGVLSQESGTCEVEPEGETATSVYCRIGELVSWSEGSYRPKFNAPTLGQSENLRNIEARALTSAGRLCQGSNGADRGYVGTRTAIIISSDVSLTELGAPYGTIDFRCINTVP